MLLSGICYIPLEYTVAGVKKCDLDTPSFFLTVAGVTSNTTMRGDSPDEKELPDYGIRHL